MVECAVVPDHRRLVRMGFVDAARRAAIDHRLGYLLEMKGVAADRQQVARAAPRRVAVIIHHPQAVVAHDTGVGHEPRVVRPGRADLKDRIAGVAPPRLERKSVMKGKWGSVRVDIGGCRICKKKKEYKKTH